MKRVPGSKWNMAARTVHTLAFLAFLATITFAPLALGSTYAWSSTTLRLTTAVILILWAISTLLTTVAEQRSHLIDGHRIEPPSDTPERKIMRRWRNIRIGALAAYLTLTIASGITNGWLWDTVQETQRIITYTAAFALSTLLLTHPWRRKAFNATLTLLAITLAGYGLLQTFDLTPTPTLSSDRVSSLYFNPNHYAGILDLLTPFMLALALFAKRTWVRISSLTITTLLASNVLLTYSRGAWVSITIAATIAIAAWTILGFGTRKPLARPITILTVLIALLASYITIDQTAPNMTRPIEQRFTKLTQDLTNLENFERVVIVRASLPLLSDNPLLGSGPGSFIYVFPRVRPPTLDVPEEAMLHRFVNYAHNDYLQVGIETGIPSLLAFLTFWITVLTGPSQRKDATAIALRLGILAILIHGLVDGNLTVIPSNAFLAYAMAGALHAHTTQDEPPPNHEHDTTHA